METSGWLGSVLCWVEDLNTLRFLFVVFEGVAWPSMDSNLKFAALETFTLFLISFPTIFCWRTKCYEYHWEGFYMPKDASLRFGEDWR